MANIQIKDLVDSVELDQQAMQAIYGGARTARTATLMALKNQELKPTTLLSRAMSNRRGRGHNAFVPTDPRPTRS